MLRQAFHDLALLRDPSLTVHLSFSDPHDPDETLVCEKKPESIRFYLLLMMGSDKMIRFDATDELDGVYSFSPGSLNFAVDDVKEILTQCHVTFLGSEMYEESLVAFLSEMLCRTSLEWRDRSCVGQVKLLLHVSAPDVNYYPRVSIQLSEGKSVIRLASCIFENMKIDPKIKHATQVMGCGPAYVSPDAKNKKRKVAVAEQEERKLMFIKNGCNSSSIHFLPLVAFNQAEQNFIHCYPKLSAHAVLHKKDAELWRWLHKKLQGFTEGPNVSSQSSDSEDVQKANQWFVLDDPLPHK